jgi:hypothetical protein
VTEVEVFPSADQLFVDVGEAVEGEVPETVVGLSAAEKRAQSAAQSPT